MKKLIATAFAIMFVTSTAHAAYPAYTKDKSAWWVSALLLPPVIGLNAIGLAVDLPRKEQDLKALHDATYGIGKHAIKGACGAAVIVNPCK